MSSFLRYLTAPLRALAAAPRWFLGLAIPGRAALVSAIFCVLCVITAFIVYITNPANSPAFAEWTFGKWLGAVALVVVIPIVVWFALKLWLEGDVSRYPDIDFAWKAGLDALQRHGIDLSDVPMFLILGTAGESATRALMQASRMGFRVKEVPPGPAALHWFVNPDGIYLVCTETCCLSKLANTGSSLQQRGGYQPVSAAPSQRSSIRATVVPGDFGDQAAATESAPQPLASPQPGIRGTMNIGGGGPQDTMLPFGDSSPSAGMPERPLPTLSPEDQADASLRLQYLCTLLRRNRAPLCPINGVITLLPYEVIQTGPGGGGEVRKAAREDLGVLTRTLQLHYPVTALVSGMHTEEGFQELVSRVGADKAREQRFGKGFGATDPSTSLSHPTMATAQQLEATAFHACGAFEDWVYSLFRARDALGQPGNRKLFSLLCKVRSNLRNRLAHVLARAYCADHDTPGPAPFFGGCYFAATGSTESQQAFVKSVFDKLVEQQSDVQWTGQAVQQENRLRTLAYLGVVFNLALIVGIAWWFSSQ